MKVLYDATPLLMRSAGVKNYHYELLVRLLTRSDAPEIELFPGLKGLPPNHNQHSNYSLFPTIRGLGSVLASNYLGLPIASHAARRADLFHATHHLFAPPDDAPLTTMVHDPTPALMPECHTTDNIRYFERFVNRTLPRLAGLITPSQAVKDDLVAHCGADGSKATVIPHGVDPSFFEATAEAKAQARAAYGLPERFVLAVGSIEPRKNLITLLDAYARLPSTIRESTPLVLVGPKGWKNDAIRNKIEETGNVIATGFVDRTLLPAVYHLATVFAFPSRYEGFGMPLLEAMAAGTPVLASNTSAIPEVVGDAGVLVPPDAPYSIATELERLLTQVDIAAALSTAGRERAATFTWERTARQTIAFWKTI